MGVPFRNEYLYTPCLLDYQIIITQNEGDLNFMIKKLKDLYEEGGWEIRFAKM